MTNETQIMLVSLMAGFYLFTCLVGGLESCFDVFRIRRSPITAPMRMLGTLMLIDVASMLFGTVLASIYPHIPFFVVISRILDSFIILLGCLLGPVVLYGKVPSRRFLALLSIPFACIPVIGILFPEYAQWIAVFNCLIYLFNSFYWSLRVLRKDKIMAHVYSNLEHRYNRWFILFPIISVVQALLYWVLLINSQGWLSEVTFYLFMVCLYLYAIRQVYFYKEPTDIESEAVLQKVVEEEMRCVPSAPKDVEPKVKERNLRLRAALEKLMNEEKLYHDADLTVNTLVRRMGTNSTDFYFMMRDEMQTRFNDYINSLRIEEAKSLLHGDANLQVSDIALRCGFNSPQAFSRTFHKFAGCSATEWKTK